MKNLFSSIINTILIVLSVIVFLGCDDDDFLTEKPTTFYTTDNIISSQDQVEQEIATLYYKVRRINCSFNGYSWRMGNGTDVYDVPTIRYPFRINDYSILSSKSDIYTDAFTKYYSIISCANTVIEAANKENVKWSSESDKKEAIAEARFFRAYSYRNLGELYGGVPLVTEVATTPRYDYERASRMETYQYAIDELEGIVNDVPESSVAGKIVRAAVQHNLSQLYIDKGVLLEQDGKSATDAYNKAVAYASAVIDGGRYKLMTERFGSRKNEDPVFYYANDVKQETADHTYAAAGYPIKGNVFWDLFQEGNQDYQDGNTEAIWVLQSDYNLYKKEENGNFSLFYVAMYGPVFRDQGGDYLSGSMEDVGGVGQVWACPTFYARDSIYAGKWSDDMRNSDAVFRRTFIGNVPGSQYYGKIVPWDVLYRNNDGKTNDNARTELFPISCKIATDKFTGIADGEDYTRLFRDDYMIRLPETILLRAEAYLRLGNKTKAVDDINKLRSRAKCGYLVNSSDVSIDLILDERARELLYEESRWNTLLRMGGDIAKKRIMKYSYWDCARTSLANKDFTLWPIPQSVIDTNKDKKMEQNPGW